MQLRRISLIFLLFIFSLPSSFATIVQEQGVRLGVLFGQSKINLEFGDDGTLNFEDKEEINTAVIYLGYQKVVANGIGFSTALSFSHLSGPKTGGDINNIMLEGNATYGFGNSSTHVFAGPNISKFGFDNDFSDEDNDVGYGLQAGFGFQIYKYLAIDLRYLYTCHSITNAFDTEVDVTTNGYRLGALYSF